MLGAGAACATSFGMVLEQPGSLEITVLRSAQPHGQGQSSSEDFL